MKINIRELLAQTSFAGKIDCIAPAFENAGIDTLASLENAPGIIQINICGESIHSIALELWQAASARAEKASALRAEIERSELWDMQGLTPSILHELFEINITTKAALAEASDQRLLALPGIGRATLKKIREQGREGKFFEPEKELD